MPRVVILLSHIPNPRMLKRVQTLEECFAITLLYWDRQLQKSESFSINPKHSLRKVSVKAPQGKTVARIIPLMKFALSAIRVLKCEKPDVIHAANLDMLMIAVFYKNFYQSTLKIVYEVGDLPKYAFVDRVSSPRHVIAKTIQTIEKALVSGISKIVLTSPYFWERYYSLFVDEDKYLFIPNAPLKRVFSEYEKQVHESFTIGFIGSVRYVTQLKMLVDVVGEVNNNASVLIAGSGPGYQEMVKYCENKEWVEIYGPYNYEREIVKLYQQVDCVYSVYDTSLDNVQIALPNRLYEAIVCELPIIAAEHTVLGEFIKENKIGATVKDDNKEDLKRVLSKWASDRDLMGYYAQNCRLIKDRYYYENNSDRLLCQYRALIESPLG